MRIVIDLQGAQASNRHRGIGRYSLWLAQAIVRNRREHDIVIALSDLFPETIEKIRADFEGLLPQESIRVWSSPGPVAYVDPGNTWRRQCAELVREAFIASLEPDFVLVSSLFEGLGDDAVTSIGLLGQSIPTATILYDLIPLIHRRPYLENPIVEAWYENRLDQLRRTTLTLAISDSSREEGMRYLGFNEDECVSISTATDPAFKPIRVSAKQESQIRAVYGLEKPFVMYTGGIDHRKNIEGLIRAYALLSNGLRAEYQLAIVCSIQTEDRARLMSLVTEHGLDASEVVFTGFVPDEDLLALYNLCKLFVFPSWHEGFGLPALEAMACGRATIGANTSSIPEVIGRMDALFDPYSDDAIAGSIARVLGDDAFRRELERNGLLQSKKFSWDITARRALDAIERRLVNAKLERQPIIGGKRPKLAYVSPLPPEHSGISDYSAELLPELARYYDIDVVVAQAAVTNEWVRANCAVRSVDWFKSNADRFDRVIYHFGNSEFHQHMFDLLDAVPGVVVLHDFFLSGIVAHMDVHGNAPGSWPVRLYESHGYCALRHRYTALDTADVVYRYPTNLNVLNAARGVIVHGTTSIRLAQEWYDYSFGRSWSIIPHLRAMPSVISRVVARNLLGINQDDFVVCAFGMIGPTKLSHRLLDAWFASELSAMKECRLVFVGENHPGQYGLELETRALSSPLKNHVQITGWADKNSFRSYLAAADVGIQLRTLSRGETSGTVLDCMAHGIATVVNIHGSMADLPDDGVWKLPDEFTDDELIYAISSLRLDTPRRLELGKRAREIILSARSPRRCADQYFAAIEGAYKRVAIVGGEFASAIAAIEPRSTDSASWSLLADSIAKNTPPKPRQRQLLVDVSELVQRDSRTGIQRVVRSLLRAWIENPPDGVRVEPVYARPGALGYRYARRFTLRFLDCPDQHLLDDDPVGFGDGDIFIALDLQPHVQLAQRPYLSTLRRRGLRVYFVVYDLLCVLMPEMFVPGAAVDHHNWLSTVAESDGALCISRAVANELWDWLQAYGPRRDRAFSIDWFQLGADLSASAPTTGIPIDGNAVLQNLSANPAFLMVGTLEPRKGHLQVLEAFDHLWRSDKSVTLVIVGKEGWLAERLVTALRNHPQLGLRLFWLEGISDEYLERVYSASTCLIAASFGEGFGLPLIEAARHNLPILARDIPVFREVAGDHASYFDGFSSLDLADNIIRWLAAHNRNEVPASRSIASFNWNESAQSLLRALSRTDPYLRWLPDDVRRFWGSDQRLYTKVGERFGQCMVSRGVAGFLIYGPYIALTSGRYTVSIRGTWGTAELNGAFMDVAVKKGEHHLCKKYLEASTKSVDILAAMPFTLEEDCTDLEVRVWVGEGASLSVHRLEIAPMLFEESPDSMTSIADIGVEEALVASSQADLVHAVSYQAGAEQQRARD